jgi:putative transposase
MVRAGVVSHPSEWAYGGYREIQEPRRKSGLIAYQKLAELAGFKIYDTFRKSHQELVQEALTNDDLYRQREPQWTESIAVGSKDFIKTIKDALGPLANGRRILENKEGFQLRETMGSYLTIFDSQGDDEGLNNAYYWDI